MKWKDHHHGLSTLIWIPVLLCVSGPKRWVEIRLGFVAHKNSYISCCHPHTTATLFFSKHHFVKDIPTFKNLLLDFRDHAEYGLQVNDSTFCSSVQSLSRVWLFVIPWTAAHQASLSITNSGAYSNSCPLSRWCHPTTSSSIVPFSSCLRSFSASGSFPMSQFFASGGQSIGVSASISVLPMNIQDWFPLGWTGWISLHSKGLSRVFSNTTVQKHQFFGAQLSLESISHIHMWLPEKP